MKLQILMSTHNGTRYLRTQLESIVAQTVRGKSLLIRDDGSADQTRRILEEYQKKYPWIRCYYGSNIGARKSFFDLMRRSDREADYIALADQDDEWMPEKLEQAAASLSRLERRCRPGEPLLYCSDWLPVDAELKPLRRTLRPMVRETSFGNALVQNVCTGCTAVANRNLVDLVCDGFRSCFAGTGWQAQMDSVIMHDWWLYLTAACFGNVYYDENAYIRYRQHGGNVFGTKTGHRQLLNYRLNELMQPRGEIFCQARAFGEIYKNRLDQPENAENQRKLRKLLKAERSLAGRIAVAADAGYFRQKRSDDLIFRGIVLIGKL
ncbi:MAG: glycosyltransferase family 2 protein [Clostridiales bacterium]|nr:glycosyltransferase family 2 protein [Clostridiales bacterium]